jgi:acyl carrier protein
VAREHLGWQGAVTAEMSLIEDLELDSLRLFTLAAEIENHFQIHLDEGDEAEMRTVGSLAEVIRRKLGSSDPD